MNPIVLVSLVTTGATGVAKLRQRRGHSDSVPLPFIDGPCQLRARETFLRARERVNRGGRATGRGLMSQAPALARDRVNGGLLVFARATGSYLVRRNEQV